MEYDFDKVDEMVLALLYLTNFQKRKEFPFQAWKGLDWDALNRLHDRDYIYDPVSKKKSITFTEEGFKLSKNLFKKHFGIREQKE